jgi:ABC-type cobalt transport system substrate-binding protein
MMDLPAKQTEKTTMTLAAIIAMHAIALANFTYHAEPAGQDVWQEFVTVDSPFSGDCEDFAFSLKKAIGEGEVMHVVLPDGRDHAVLIVQGVILDNLYPPATVQSWTNHGAIILMPMDSAKTVKRSN